MAIRSGAMVLSGLMLAASACAAQSPFDGTWRPDPQKPGADQKPDVIALLDGAYECKTCSPPYKVKADGADHSVSGNPRFDTIRVTAVDDRTITKTAQKAGRTVVESTAKVSSDGRTLSERQLLSDVGPRPIDFTSTSARVAAGPQGAHVVSGTWQLIEADLTNHDEDTTFKIANDVLFMHDRMGRSFAAKLDGTDAPYQGDPEFTSVSVKMLDARTIEESDKHAGRVVKIDRWSLDPDGKTIHARFDDTQGHVMTQDGHRVP